MSNLHGTKGNPRVHKSLITAKLSGINVDWDDTFVFKVANKTNEYLAKFPLGQVPAFGSNDGLLLTESNAIPFYLADLKESNPLFGKDKAEFAKIHQYAFFIETQFMPNLILLLLPSFGVISRDSEIEKLGDSLTLADILVGEDLAFAYSMAMDETRRNKFPNLTKYFLNYRAITEIKEIAGETKLCEVALKVSA